MKRQSAFTLIEVLVALAIFGINLVGIEILDPQGKTEIFGSPSSLRAPGASRMLPPAVDSTLRARINQVRPLRSRPSVRIVMFVG